VEPRYGELREGEAVLIFVTETFTAGQRVKSDGGHPDEFPVLKLNDSREFQTGIYDYDVMTSTFARLDGGLPLGVPTKVSLSVSEWCGNVYDQLLIDEKRYRRSRHSYFDGEADLSTEEKLVPGGILGDTVPILVRGLTGPWPAVGETFEVPYLPTLLDARFAHSDLAWTTATFSRSPAISEITVPAGTFRVWTVEQKLADGKITTWAVEEAAPHRIVRWERSDGEKAELTGSIRAKYWEQNANGGEAALRDLGLQPP
jgi:hypothetical protein